MPDLVNCDNVREFLRQAQLGSGEFRPIIDQLRAELDPEGVKKRRTGAPKVKGNLRPIELESYRLSPVDGVLERSVNLAVEVLNVPCIPEVQVAMSAPMINSIDMFAGLEIDVLMKLVNLLTPQVGRMIR